MRNQFKSSPPSNEKVQEFIKEETERLKEIINTLSDSEINMILRGERPLRIDFDDFRVLRKSYQDQIKNYLKHKIRK